MKNLSRTLLLLSALAVFAGMNPGCSCEDGTGGDVVLAGSVCTSNTDCFNGFMCDLETSQCVEASTITDDVGNNAEPDAGGDASASDVGDTEDEVQCVGFNCDEPCSPSCSAGEVCDDGVCICVNDEHRPCGNKAGECRYGTETCVDNVWSECVGGISPVEEICDHLDNDCDGRVDEAVTITYFRDIDNDGFGEDDTLVEACEPEEGFVAVGGDCDDTFDSVYPDAPELCDLRDNDCDGALDEDSTSTFYPDNDEDGFGSDEGAVEACEPSAGFVSAGGDCDDDNGDIHPDVDEVCDGLDNNCDGFLDSDDPMLQPAPVDCLSEGVCDGTRPTCAGPAGWVCAYTSELYEAVELTRCDGFDNDCDGSVDEGLRQTFYLDNDGDDFGSDGSAVVACAAPSEDYTTTGGDCNDGSVAVYPGAAEICDGLDNDCDTLADQMDPDLVNSALACLQQGVCQNTQPTCQGASGWACVYTSDAYEPNDESLCDARDNDCDGSIDETISRPCGTNIGVCSAGTAVCELGEFVRCSGNVGIPPTDDETIGGYCDGFDNDCDGRTDEGCACNPGDTVACGINIGACTTGVQNCVAGMLGECTGQGPVVEFCDAGFVDHDCNGQDDIQQGLTTPFYLDMDGDGFGGGALLHKCGPIDPMQQEVAVGGDCRDDVMAINPGAAEICDGIDNNCAGGIDEGALTPDITCLTQGVCAGTQPTCEGLSGWVCDYTSLYEAVETRCDAQDNDCDGSVDEGLTTTFYIDLDRDGYGVGNANSRCGALGDQEAPQGGDCRDDVMAINPGAEEICDGIDNDCVGGVDDDPTPSAAGCDQDGVCAGTQPTCEGLSGWVCDYTSPFYEPGSETSCDARDNDCDGSTDEGLRRSFYVDDDEDGWGAGSVQTQCGALVAGQAILNGDCRDDVMAINPGAEEICDGIDNDCFGGVDDNPTPSGMACDQDGVCAGTQPTCEGLSGWVCDYTSPFYEPGSETSCDARDNDCDGSTDEGLTTPYYTDSDRDGYGDGPQRARCGALGVGESANSDDCDDLEGDINPDADEICFNTIDEDCDTVLDNGCDSCNPAIDEDFDGANQCDDCDETNGAIRPGAAERCNGVDDDCDDSIDEDFDMDGDTFSVCATDPANLDCDDTMGNVNPGAAEDCGPGNNGNGIDENCNGYIDEGCGACDPNDTDGDSVSECDGDCAPDEGSVYPGAPEMCDGLDNDCNTFTTENCDVSDPCNWTGDADVCRSDLLCACAVNNAGNCTGDYICTALCNTSETGPVGDGCEEDQTCLYDLLRTANTHGCAEVTGALGAGLGGEPCSGDDDCRSNSCVRVFTGSNGRICYDYCGSDNYCTASNTVCRLSRTAEQLDGRCWPEGSAGVGTRRVGDVCTTDSQCDHGLCANVDAERYCTEACCTDSDCPADYHCGLRGDQIDTTFVTVPPDAPDCTSTPECPTGMLCFTAEGKCAWRLTETSPMCLQDEPGQDTRQAGAACAANDECESNFCEANLGVCIDVCCSDAACPSGTNCELLTVQTTSDRVTSARVCVNLSTDDVLLRQ